ncbi:MAG: replicative DNA helicase [Fimbriimonadales bacterium]
MRTSANEFVPLQSVEAEMSTLGAMILSERSAEEVVNIVSEDDFYLPAHREIYRAMRSLLNINRPIDLLTLKLELIERGTLADVGGEDYLIQVAEFVPSALSGAHYARIVQEKAMLRRLETAGHGIIKVVREDDGTADDKLDKAEQLIYDVGAARLGQDFVEIKSLAKDFMVDMDTLVETGEPMLGVPSGFVDLDRMTTGFYGGDFIIVAARPSMGKTSLVLNMGINVARRIPGNVAIFSLEMSGKQLARRIASMISGISSHVLKRSDLSNDSYRRLADACEVMYDLPIYIDESSDISGLEMKAKCRRLKREGGLSLVMVDYLQLMKGNRRTDNRVQEISEIARSLKAMAKDLDVPVVALSQLNRGVENRENKRPQLADIRESGSIEAEADLVMFIYRDEYYKARENPEEYAQDHNPDRVEESEIIIAKHRNGPVGTVKLGFQPSYARFVNLKQ